MAPPGPRPKSAALRLLHGTHPERVNRDEPVPSAGVPSPPEGMSEAVLEVWHRTVAELSAMGVLTPADRDALAAFCEAVVIHRRACALLARSDVMVKGVEGGPVRNPAVAIARDAAVTVRMFASEFGLTPSARSRLAVPTRGEVDNPFAG